MKSTSKKVPLVERVLDALAFVATNLAGAMIVVLVMSFGWLVFGRYVLNDTPTWVEQMAMLLIVGITFLAAAVGIYERTHLSVEMITLVISKKVALFIECIINLLLAAFGFALAWYTNDLMSFTQFQKIPLLGISESYRYLPVVISGGLIFIFSLYRAYQGLTELFNPSSKNNELGGQ
ncbi:TRAP transporter small permease [Marinomonas mediterranea]|uniref:TRAP transporter small permease n=1 Tax=Marinomonas mediterranea TaxID=119864 RepID=UPI00234ABF88|nr:TRAP transporter small permease [Marinomonas mediterranea]WCN07469.1 TRAP transporter small permease subunit [Marinomonas mediterranea]